MKKLLLTVLLVAGAVAGDKQDNSIDFMDFAYMNTGGAVVSPVQLVNEYRNNPHSRAIGQRIAGWVLLGTAVLNFVIAVPYGELLNDAGEDGGFYTGLIFAEGGIRAGIGGILLGVGYYKYSRWKNWEREHARSSSGGYRLAFNVEY